MFTKLAENGYSPLAIQKNKKVPTIKGWQNLCENIASDELLSVWDADFAKGKIGVGVALGRASNLIAIDIDIDDEDLKKILPLSPVVRRGAKGEVRFFRFCESQETRHFSDLLGISCVDILSTGSQVVIPPTIHPETNKPYVWLSVDTLENTTANDLPIFDPSFMPTLERWLHNRNQVISQKSKIDPSYFGDGKVSSGGRNNKLKAIVTAMRAKGKTEEECIDEIYNYDLAKHSPRLFTDKNENKSVNGEDDAYNNAARFYASVNHSLINSGVIKLKREEKELVIEINTEAESRKSDKFKLKPYPKARGIMADFIDYCNLTSSGNQDALGLGGAISLMSAICSNRFVTKARGLTTCPNTYVINLAHSSFGKETAQRAIQELLTDSGLLGSGNYRSGTSIVMNLPKQQERLDIIDECSSLLKSMSSKEDYKSEIVEILSSLYTKGNSKFIGFSSVGNGANFGACFNPHVSILGSTTPNGFRGSVSRDVAAKGLLPRILLFNQGELGEYKGRNTRQGVEDLFQRIRETIDIVLQVPKNKVEPEVNLLAPIKDKDGKDITEGYRYIQTVVPMTKDAETLWLDIDERCHYEKAKDPDGFESAFIGRFSELTAKLALLDAVSVGSSVITKESVEWAQLVVETQWHNAMPLYELASSENKNEANLIRVLKIIEQKGMIQKSELVQKTRWLTKRERVEIIETLLDTQVVEVIKSKGTTRPIE